MPWKRVKFDEMGQNNDADPVLLQYVGGKFVTIFPAASRRCRSALADEVGGRVGAGAMTAETSIQHLPPLVIARREATKQSTLSFYGTMDCFAALAMTGLQSCASRLESRL